MTAYVVWRHSLHCFLVVPVRDGYAIELDGARGVPTAALHDCGEGIEPGQWYADQGMCVVAVPLPQAGTINLMPVMAATCVGMVKRYLNIWAPWVITPAQLYRHLKRRFHSGR